MKGHPTGARSRSECVPFQHTRWPALIAFFGYWLLGLPTGAVLAYRLGWGPRGLWWGLTLGLSTVALLFLIRIRSRFSTTIVRLPAG